MTQKLDDPRVLLRDLAAGLAIGVVVMLVRVVGWMLGAWETIVPR